MRRVLIALLAAVALTGTRAEAVSVRDLIELSKAGLGDSVLMALLEVDRSVFTIDTATLKQLKEGGVSEAVIVAVIKSGRTAQPQPAPVQESEPEPRDPQVVVIDHHEMPATPPPPVYYPVAVPVYVPAATLSRRYADRADRTVTTVLPTDQGLVRARVPVPANCVKAEPVYWGFDGKLRPGSWQPAPTVVCK